MFGDHGRRVFMQQSYRTFGGINLWMVDRLFIDGTPMDRIVQPVDLVLACGVPIQRRAYDQARCQSCPELGLLTAAAAERYDAVLHYDADFEHIAAVTGQTTDWIIPRGSVS